MRATRGKCIVTARKYLLFIHTECSTQERHYGAAVYLRPLANEYIYIHIVQRERTATASPLCIRCRYASKHVKVVSCDLRDNYIPERNEIPAIVTRRIFPFPRPTHQSYVHAHTGKIRLTCETNIYYFSSIQSTYRFLCKNVNAFC